MPSISYYLPEKEILAELIGIIPATWCWIDGILTAGRELYEKNMIARNTRLCLSRFHDINPTIIPVYDVPFEDKNDKKEKPKTPNFPEIFLKGKLVSSVSFDEAGFESYALPFYTARDLASEFIRLGYKGWLYAYSGYRDNNKFDNPERFEISHKDGKIKLQWDESNDGKRENLDVFTKKLEELKIRECVE